MAVKEEGNRKSPPYLYISGQTYNTIFLEWPNKNFIKHKKLMRYKKETGKRQKVKIEKNE